MFPPFTDVETDSGHADRQAPGRRPPQASEGGLAWLGEVALEASLGNRTGLHHQLSSWPHGLRTTCRADVLAVLWTLPEGIQQKEASGDFPGSAVVKTAGCQ